MSIENDLCMLGLRITDVKESVREARKLAISVLYADPEGRTWPELESIIDTLEAVERQINTLPGENIQAIIAAAEETLDEMSDRADGMSY